jgi:hypothetical protein
MVLVAAIPNNTVNYKNHEVQKLNNITVLESDIPNKNTMEYNTMNNNELFSDYVQEAMYNIIAEDIE